MSKTTPNSHEGTRTELSVVSEWPTWAQRAWETLRPFKDQVVTHPYFTSMADGTLDLTRFQRGLIGFYPLVESFPRHLALILAKTMPATVGHHSARHWLIENIAIEQRHSDWWRDWAIALGCTEHDLDGVRPAPAMDAINHYLWNVNTHGTLHEAIAATNIGIEWPTGEWTARVLEGVKLHPAVAASSGPKDPLRWLVEHASYDDHHPYDAMSILCLLADTTAKQQAVIASARRAMEYIHMALDDCYI